MSLNGVELRTLGLLVEGVTGHADAIEQTWAGVDLPGFGGQGVFAGAPTLAPRDLVVRGVLRGATPAALLAFEDRLRGLCAHGLSELVTVDQPGRVRRGYLRGITVRHLAAELDARDADVQIRFYCPDPRAIDEYPTVVGASAGVRVPVPLGTHDVAPITTIVGAATNPVLTLRGVNGLALGTLGLTITLGAADYLVVDHRDYSLTRWTNGVKSDANGTPRTGHFFTLSPSHGDVASGVYPTLEVSSGALVVQLWRTWA